MTADSRIERVIRNVVITLVVLVIAFYAVMVLALRSRATLPSYESGPASRPPNPAATPADQAVAAIVHDLNGDLNSGFLSPGQTYGGPFTEGTVVDQVEAHGGVVLSMHSNAVARGLTQNTAAVMLGLGSASGTPTCFSISFTIAHDSAHQQLMPCPGASAVELGRTLLQQPRTRWPQEAAPGAYPVTASGVRTLLHDRFGAQAATEPLETAASTFADSPVLVAAVRIRGVCHFVRLGTSSTITSWVPVWPAPLDDQSSCDAAQALAADGLFGADPAQEG